MAFSDQYDFENLVNEAERMVIDDLEKELQDPAFAGICTCEDCILDMAALALNSVKPVYRVSLLGSLYAGAMEQTDYKEAIQKAVKSAIQKVSANPSHT